MSTGRKLVSVAAADFLRVHRGTLYGMLKRHELPGASKIGRVSNSSIFGIKLSRDANR